jgi:hypothetical protein
MEEMMKRLLVILAVVVATPVASAFAQTTVSYSASVTSASGVDAAAFSAGDSLTFSYTLNPGVADSNGDTSQGFFLNAVLALSVSFPGRGVSAAAGAAGNVQTFDNIVDGGSGKWSDQPTGSYYWFMIVDDDNNGVLEGKFHDVVQTIITPPS